MSPSQHHLAESLKRISAVLGATPEQHAVFEHWALAQLRALVNAEQENRQALRWQAMEFRQQYLELQQELSMGIAVTGRTELVRAARKEFLCAILDLVDELIDERAAA